MIAALVAFAVATGFFIGVAAAVAVAHYLETLQTKKLARSKAVETLAADYVKTFGGTIQEAKKHVNKQLVNV